jgi:V8-like Glu-specific endopeptidase
LATKDGQYFCGAALIGPSHVLTAAHCFIKIKTLSQVEVMKMPTLVTGNQYSDFLSFAME